MMIGLFIVNFQVPPSARYIYGCVLKISPTRYLSGYILNIYLYNLSWLPLGSNVLVFDFLYSVCACETLLFEDLANSSYRNDQTFFCQSPVQLLGAKFCFLSFRNDFLFHPNRCFIRACLWYGSLWFQGILTIPLVCGKPSFQTPFAVWTYLSHIYQLHPLFRYRFYPPQTLFFNCFRHTYRHFPILGETAISPCTLPRGLDIISTSCPLSIKSVI